jgi:hypothetical protein
MTNIILCIIIGLVAGTLSGLLGIGGGIIIVPALIYIFGMNQHLAQGTTLALMVPPIGLLAAWTYYKEGYVDLKIAALICLGFFIGGLIGASLSIEISEAMLKRSFGIVFLTIAVKMTFF